VAAWVMGSAGDEATGDEDEAGMLRGIWEDERIRNAMMVFGWSTRVEEAKPSANCREPNVTPAPMPPLEPQVPHPIPE
jgi:hypothetical protein